MENSLRFSKCLNISMNVEIEFTFLNACGVCVICNLSAIRGHIKRLFGSILFVVLLLTPYDGVPMLPIAQK